METSVHTKFDTSIILPELAVDPIEPHFNLRPKNFDEYPGQERVGQSWRCHPRQSGLLRNLRLLPRLAGSPHRRPRLP